MKKLLGLCLTASALHAEPARPNIIVILSDELQTSIFPSRTRDGHPVLMGPDIMPGPPESYIAYGRNWATF